MIRNIICSLLIHFIFLALIIFNFDLIVPEDNFDKEIRVAINFASKSVNNKNDSIIKKPQTPEKPKEMPKLLPPKKEIKKEIKKSVKKPTKNPTKNPIKKTIKKTLGKNKKAPKKKNKEKPKPKKIEQHPKPEKPNKKQEPPKEPAIIAKPNSEKEIQKVNSVASSVIGLNLPFRDKFNIQSQINRCYRRALEESNKKVQMPINAHIFIAQDGFIDLEVMTFKDLSQKDTKIEVKNIDKVSNDTDFMKAKVIIKKALEFCSPIRNLPVDKYDIWKEIDLKFN